jgi:ABC-type transport system substrate-binding protein
VGEKAQGNFTGGKQDKMSLEMDRRSFLTNSAATIGGVAMAGTVVDSLIAGSAGAASAVGINTGTPKLGGTLTVSTNGDALSLLAFSGPKGSWGASHYVRGMAIYDKLFEVAIDGKTVLPMLATSITASQNFTVWTMTLRQDIKFHNGTAFNADVVVKNYQACGLDNSPVGPAISPLIKSVVKGSSDYEVIYNLLIPIAAWPLTLAASQIAFMAEPSTLVKGYNDRAIGTGPFMMKSASDWVYNDHCMLAKNPNYWRTDAKGRQLPYLDALNIKVILDDEAAYQAVQAGSIDIAYTTDVNVAHKMMSNKKLVARTDVNDPREPAVAYWLMNTTGTLNQFSAWAKLALSYILKGAAVPTLIQQALAGDKTASAAVAKSSGITVAGAVNPSTLAWDGSYTNHLTDPTIRRAIAQSIDPKAYVKTVTLGNGTFADGIFKKSSQYYQNPQYPTFNPSAAKKAVKAYKDKNNLSDVKIVLDYPTGSAATTRAFTFLQAACKTVGITVVGRPQESGVEIANFIDGLETSSLTFQFGGIDQSFNYIWWNSVPAAGSNVPLGLGLPAWPYTSYAGKGDYTTSPNVAGGVNFQHQNNPNIQRIMQQALAAPGGSSQHAANWRTVNNTFASEATYVFLDQIVTGIAASKKVQNWMGRQVSGKQYLPQGGEISYDQAWKA